MSVNLKALAYEVREGALDIIFSGKTGHIGGDFSEAEILTTLYFHVMNISPENADSPDRDYFILSKGHSMESYYTVLAKKGFLDYQWNATPDSGRHTSDIRTISCRASK